MLRKSVRKNALLPREIPCNVIMLIASQFSEITMSMATAFCQAMCVSETPQLRSLQTSLHFAAKPSARVNQCGRYLPDTSLETDLDTQHVICSPHITRK